MNKPAKPTLHDKIVAHFRANPEDTVVSCERALKGEHQPGSVWRVFRGMVSDGTLVRSGKGWTLSD